MFRATYSGSCVFLCLLCLRTQRKIYGININLPIVLLRCDSKHESQAICYAVRKSCSEGLSLNLPILPLSSDSVLDMLAKLQLSAVGVKSPESSAEDPLAPLWKSPKSPKSPNEPSSCSSSDKADVNVKGSSPLAAAASENGPKASWWEGRRSA